MSNNQSLESGTMTDAKAEECLFEEMVINGTPALPNAESQEPAPEQLEFRFPYVEPPTNHDRVIAGRAKKKGMTVTEYIAWIGENYR